MASAASAPVFERVAGIRGIAESGRFKAWFLDQFGVLHDGKKPYPGAILALEKLAGNGAKMVIISNSSRRSSVTMEKLKSLGFDTSCFLATITSGELTYQHLQKKIHLRLGGLNGRERASYIISFSTPHGAGFKTFSPKLSPPSALLHPKPPLPLRPTSRSFWIHFLVQMEQLDSKFHQKYTALKKRKLLDEGLERKREAELKELYDAMKDWTSELKKDNDELKEKLAVKEDELEKARQEFLEDIRTRDSEILRLKQLLDEKAEKNNSTATGSPGLTTEAIVEKSTPMLPKRKTPLPHGKIKRVQLIENAPHSSPTEEYQELECSRRHSCISGNGTDEIPSARMFHLLLQSLVRMKISVNDGTEMFSVSVCHEASGYRFTLTWLEKHGEWSYKLSSLGTLDRIAVDWMRQDIRFSTKMCHMFFQRISSIITKG